MLNKCKRIQPEYLPIVEVVDYQDKKFIVTWAPALSLPAFAAEEAVTLLAGKGTREYGVRPLRRAIANLVEDPAADLMLAGQLKKGDTLCVSAQGDEVKVRLV